MSQRRRTIDTKKYWLTAFCFILSRIFFLGALASIVALAVTKDQEMLYFTAAMAGGTLLTFLVKLANTSSVICPLCRTPVFTRLGGAQAKKSRMRLGFALKLLTLTKRPKCIHCREPFRWQS